MILLSFLIVLPLVLFSQQGSTQSFYYAGHQDLHSSAQGQIEVQTGLKDPSSGRGISYLNPTDSLGCEVNFGFDNLTQSTKPEVTSFSQGSPEDAFSDTDIPIGGLERIIGGANAPDDLAPYQASLRRRNVHLCGGCILSKRDILTAAHCLEGNRAGSFAVVVGTNSLMHGGIRYGTERVVIHPYYDAEITKCDIGMVRVDDDIQFTAKIKYINLPTQRTADRVPLVLTGFGVISYDSYTDTGTSPIWLQWLVLHSVNIDKCRWALSDLGSSGPAIDHSQICAFLREGQAGCKGDSGGPLVEGDNVVGVMSWGVSCARGLPDVFTGVFYFKEWILSQMWR